MWIAPVLRPRTEPLLIQVQVWAARMPHSVFSSVSKYPGGVQVGVQVRKSRERSQTNFHNNRIIRSDVM